MTITNDLCATAVYNPALLTRDELVAQFTARVPLLATILDDLRRADPVAGAQHHLVLGQRGMGKSMLLRRLCYAVEDDEALASRWFPLVFPEEQYNVTRPSDLWVNCLDALGDALATRGRDDEADALDARIDALPRSETPRAREALAILTGWAAERELGLVLLVDNVDLVLERLTEHHWALREVLSEEKRLVLVGASAAALEPSYDYGAAFYDFFRVHELAGIGLEEAKTLVLTLSELCGTPRVAELLERDPGRLRSLHLLTGGNPRTLVLLHGVLALGSDDDIRRDLERLLDLCTPLYKARFEDMPVQAQKVVDALAQGWHPMTAAAVAEATRLPVNAVSSQLNRLVKQGVVAKVPYPPGKRAGFMVAERFFNIWYLMRSSRRVRRRLLWLVQFLRTFYGAPEVRRRARTYLIPPVGGHSPACDHHAEMALAYAQAVDEPPLARALELSGLEQLMEAGGQVRRKLAELLDLDGEDAPLRPAVDHMEKLREVKRLVFDERIRWPEGTGPEEMWELFGGSISFSADEKVNLARRLSGASNEDLVAVACTLRREYRQLERISGATPARQLTEALRRGFMLHAYDLPGAEAAALRLNAPMLPLLTTLSRLRDRRETPSWLPDLAPDVSQAPDRPSDDELSELERQLANHNNGLLLALYCGLLASIATQPERLERACRAALAAEEHGPLSLKSLADVMARKLRWWDKAEETLHRALALDETDASARGALGRLLLERDRLDEAEQTFRRCVEQEPTSAVHWHNLGVARLRAGRPVDATTALRKATELDSEFAAAWDLLGYALARQDDVGGAEAAYRRAVSLEPESATFCNSLAWHLCRNGARTDEMESLARAAAEAEPDNPHVGHTLACVLIRRHKWSEAVRWMRRVLAWDESIVSEHWADVETLFGEAARRGFAAEAGALLDETGVGERWLPLREALRVLEEGNRDSLLRLAPEVRRPAEEVLERLVGENAATPPPSSPPAPASGS